MNTNLNMILEGKLIEVGTLSSGNRGFQVEVEGEVVEVNGLTVGECQAAAIFVGERVMVTVRVEKA